MNTTTEVLRDAIVSYRAVIVDYFPEEDQVRFYTTQRSPLSNKDPGMSEFVGGQEDDMDCTPDDTISRESDEEAGFELDLYSLKADPYTYVRNIDGQGDPKFGWKHVVTFVLAKVVGSKEPVIGAEQTMGFWGTFEETDKLNLTAESRAALYELGPIALSLLIRKPTRPQIEVLDITDPTAISLDLNEDY